MFLGNPLSLDNTFVRIRLDLQSIKPNWLKHLCIQHWWFVQKLNCSMNWKTSVLIYGIMDTRNALFKSPCLWNLRFLTINQKKDRKSVHFTWSSLGLAKFLWILKSKSRLLSTDVSKLLNFALFLQQEKFCLQFIKMFYPSFRKVWSYITTCAGVTVGTWVELPKDCRTALINTFRDRATIRNGKRLTKNLPNREHKITSTPSVYCDSAIGQHSLESEECSKHCSDAQFSILATARPSFHLSSLEATYIKFLHPILCRQKEFIYSLQISL